MWCEQRASHDALDYRVGTAGSMMVLMYAGIDVEYSPNKEKKQ